MTRPQPDPAPDYTNAFLVVSYMILVMTLWVVWGLWGYLAALGTCGLVHAGIARLAAARADR